MRDIYKSFSLVIILTSVLSSCSKKGCTDPMSLAYDIEAKKDDGSCTYPEVSKKSLVLRKTGDWCHYCGEYATEWVNDIENTYSNTVKVIDLHSNDGFAVDVGYNMLNILGSMSTPGFAVGSEVQPLNYSQITQAINSDILLAPDVNIDLNFSIQDGKMNINIHSLLSPGISGDNYYLAAYILEDGQVANQKISGYVDPVTGTNVDPNFTHNNILRTEGSGSGNPFGNLLEFDADGNNITSLSDIILAPSTIWNHDNLYVVAVVWQQDGSGYKFVNLEN